MLGVSLTQSVLPSFLSGEFLLQIQCWLHFSVGSFSYKFHAGLIFLWGVFLLHIPCWLLFLIWGVSLTHPVLFSFFLRNLSLTSRAASFLSGEFLLHIRCWLCFYMGSFSFSSFLSGEFLYRSRGSFSYTCCAGLMFSWGGFVTPPKRPSFICGEFLLHTLYWLHFMQGVVMHIPCWLFKKIFFFIWEVSLTHPVFVSFFFFSGEFLLLIPCWLHFYLGSFSYTSRAGFSFINWPSLTHPMLILYLPGEFLLHILC